MPLEVTKKVVLADCAWAGCAAINETARHKHAGEIILMKMDIDFLRITFCRSFLRIAKLLLIDRPAEKRAWSDINPTGATLFRFRNAAMKGRKTKKQRTRNEKAPRNQPQRLVPLGGARRSGLLDRREFPTGAARPQEGPHLRHLGRRFAARDQLAGGAVDGLVDQREPHRHAGEIGIALAPGFR